ncbi:hypothetical protein COO91_09190 (plasmid) [Nostoc flagelliforme CCNUN1]|uniref:Uncharacterized protein n=1 Tax=Nostoc flagelliforme CCNUN1 TaxID=2038116 RepID=A0A2K8T5Q9_9NOSO|nr:hypothetical protein COO91_09190 [Nostoc flagelliforme CCNUN1]
MYASASEIANLILVAFSGTLVSSLLGLLPHFPQCRQTTKSRQKRDRSWTVLRARYRPRF